jgi:alpha-beta hydrolase superfamily lysophospholipase
VVSESYLIPSEDPGIQLYIRNKHREGMRQFSAERTVIYVNGATQASEATFDLALGGYSWMDYLATHGYDVYFVDLRGYGSSSRPAEMQQPAADNPPWSARAPQSKIWERRLTTCCLAAHCGAWTSSAGRGERLSRVPIRQATTTR